MRGNLTRSVILTPSEAEGEGPLYSGAACPEQVKRNEAGQSQFGAFKLKVSFGFPPVLSVTRKYQRVSGGFMRLALTVLCSHWIGLGRPPNPQILTKLFFNFYFFLFFRRIISSRKLAAFSYSRFWAASSIWFSRSAIMCGNSSIGTFLSDV